MTTNITESITLNEQRLRAVQARDRDADGSFVYAVTTTGVYCRPSCPSRAARPENMRYFATALEAERAGFRPCRRCKPQNAATRQQQAELIAELCRDIRTAEKLPALAELAQRAGLSPHYFHRLFKSLTGVTPKAYIKAERARRMQTLLADGISVTEAIYAAGYPSSSRFYAEAEQTLGMPANLRRQGGKAMRIRFAVGACSLGAILVAQSQIGICAILLGDDPDVLVRDLQDRFPAAELVGGEDQYERTVALVIGFVENPQSGLDLPLDVRGTVFQLRVWQALQTIPAGSTASYTEIAERIGTPGAIRAVAGACAANPLAVAIPCHRVVRKNGDLSGYRWGIERKKTLLDREAQD